MDSTGAKFLAELDLIGCYTDDHIDVWDGNEYTTPSIINHDDGKETDPSGD